MRKLFLLLALPLVACGSHGDDASAAGVPPSGGGTSRSYDVSGFTGVALTGSDDADVRTGAAFAVRAQGPADQLDDLVIRRRGDTLVISRRPHSGFHWGGRKVKVFVTMPTIDKARIAGSGDMTVDTVRGHGFSGATAGSGNLSVHRVSVDSLALAIDGSGDIAADGSARTLSASVNGSGDITAGGLTAQQADVSVAGSGDIKATVNGQASVSIMGSGDVDLGSGARCTVSKHGSGEVRCGH
ncbi:MAG: head GIN domain-containing protein [Sphingomonas sp.]